MRLPRRPRVMLVTGGSGFVGRHLIGGPSGTAWQIIAPASMSMDIRDRDATIRTVRDWKPAAVVHLAYRKDERSTIEDGSHHVAEGAAAARARLVHLSTDVVFAGRMAPYTEADEPDPIIDYGRQKHRAERLVADAHPGAVIVRTSIVYGTDHLSPAQLELAGMVRSRSTGSMTFFTDEFRCPVHAGDLATAISDLAARPDISGPLHVTGPERVSRAELARLMVRQLGAGDADLSTLIPTSTLSESGMVRPGRVELDVTKAASLGIICRPVSAVLDA